MLQSGQLMLGHALHCAAPNTPPAAGAVMDAAPSHDGACAQSRPEGGWLCCHPFIAALQYSTFTQCSDYDGNASSALTTRQLSNTTPALTRSPFSRLTTLTHSFRTASSNTTVHYLLVVLPSSKRADVMNPLAFFLVVMLSWLVLGCDLVRTSQGTLPWSHVLAQAIATAVISVALWQD